MFNNKFYTVKEIADMLGVTRQRVHQIIEERKIAKYYRTPGKFLIKRKDVQDLIKIKKVK